MVSESEGNEMKLIKMRIVDSADFQHVMNECQKAFGFIVAYKRTLVWLACFDEMDAVITRQELEQVGSKYAGLWKF